MSSEKISLYSKHEPNSRSALKKFQLPARLDFSRFISDEDVQTILHTQKSGLSRSKSNSRGRVTVQSKGSFSYDIRKKAQTPSPQGSPDKFQRFYKPRESDSQPFDSKESSFKSNKKAEMLEEKMNLIITANSELGKECESLEETITKITAKNSEDQLIAQSKIELLTSELSQYKTKAELETQNWQIEIEKIRKCCTGTFRTDNGLTAKFTRK